MRIRGEHYQAIWPDEEDPRRILVIDQRKLPFQFSIRALETAEDAFNAIREMTVRGAPLIGITGAFGLYLSVLHAPAAGWKNVVKHDMQMLSAARPTAVNLFHAIDHVWNGMKEETVKTNAVEKAFNLSLDLLEDERDRCRRIGEHGVKLIETLYREKGSTIHILTHCNAGWLACLDYGTATAPIYMAHDLGIPLHVWVDETRPRNQGARLTAFELGEHGVPCTLITDNAGGHLMQHGKVDLVIVGSDRTTARGDVANKIGTYLKALAAQANGVPFYVALPTSSIDYGITDGLKEIPIEERDGEEVLYVEGATGQVRDAGSIASGGEGAGKIGDPNEPIGRVRIAPDGARAANYGFDVTPAELVTGYITEEGVWGSMKSSMQKRK